MKRTRVEQLEKTAIDAIPDELMVCIVCDSLSAYDITVEETDEQPFLRELIHFSLVNKRWHRIITTMVLPLYYKSYDSLAESMHYTEWPFKHVAHRFDHIDLEMGHHPIDNTYMSYMTNLEKLSINGNVPVTERAFHHLTKLRELRLWDNTSLLNRTNSLIHLGLLESLEMVNSAFPLGERECHQMTRLQTLRLYGDAYTCTDIENIGQYMTQLNTLKIRNMRYYFNFAWFHAMRKLESLSLIECDGVRNLSMGMIPSLKSLAIDFHVFNPATFTELTHLTSLKLNVCSHINLPPNDWTVNTVFPSSLTSLKIDHAFPFTDNHLSMLTNLTSLSVRNCANIMGKSLVYLTRLTNIAITNTGTISLERLHPLRMLTSLRMCSLRPNTPLSYFDTLPTLSLIIIDETSRVRSVYMITPEREIKNCVFIRTF